MSVNEPGARRVGRAAVVRIGMILAVLSVGAAAIILTIRGSGSEPADDGGLDSEGLQADRDRIDAIEHDLCRYVSPGAREKLGIESLPEAATDLAVALDCLIGSEESGNYLLIRIYSDSAAIDADDIDGRPRTSNGLRTIEIDRLRSTDRPDFEDGKSIVFWKEPYSGFVEYIGPSDAGVAFPTLSTIIERVALEALPAR